MCILCKISIDKIMHMKWMNETCGNPIAILSTHELLLVLLIEFSVRQINAPNTSRKLKQLQQIITI